MPGRTAANNAINTEMQKGRRSTQRERLLAGMVAAANRDGYASASVTAVITQAGVSRPTFYEYFNDRDDCFLAALSDAQARLAGEVENAARAAGAPRAAVASVQSLVEFASRKPALAQFVMNEAMTGGPRALEVRDAGIARIAMILDEAHAQLPAQTPYPAIPAAAMTGGVYRLLATRLRRGEPRISALADELSAWAESYNQPAGEQRWRTLQPVDGTPPPSPYAEHEPLRPPPTLPPGRPRLSEEEVAQNHRQRILYAAAQLAGEKGYAATKVADITRLAGVDGRPFYRLFRDKEDAFMAVHEIGFQQVMDVTAAAFFSAPDWPERSWEAGRAFTQFLQNNPLVAHVGFVEAHAVGPGAVQRVEDSHTAFTVFLQEGYQNLAVAMRAPSRLALEAIVTSVFELVYCETRKDETPKLAGLLGHILFIWLAPFLGAEGAEAFIDQKMKAGKGRGRKGP
jgi:AcrR family transcriptional regulator